MDRSTDDVRIQSLRPLLPPAILMEELPLDAATSSTVTRARAQIEEVLAGRDDRLVVVVGPCSIHDTDAALEYAARLYERAGALADDLLIVMRTYFEKPRTTVGWKGLINDPHLDETFSINHGLRLARGLLRDVTALGLPVGTEFLDPITPQFIADVVSWGAIGARTSESQVHRQLASGLSMPVGFKNGTDGNIQIALDAIVSARHPHHFLSVTKQSVAAIVETCGNPSCHLILRGGSGSPNYAEELVVAATERLAAKGVSPRLMIDCSHANSGKDHVRQPDVAEAVARQIEGGAGHIMGVMLESFLEDGRQTFVEREQLRYGQSITDACMGWARTLPVLERLAVAVKARRAR